MRHNFVNDIGDYAKYALLRALHAGRVGSTLGVVWYLTEHAEDNTDGRRRPHLLGDGWERLDAALLTAMRSLERKLPSPEDRHLSLIETSGILPPGTRYFGEPVPLAGRSARARIEQRAAWFGRARAAVAGCDLVFLDPDNGLEVASVAPGSPRAGKYASAEEVAALLSDGATVVLYQHGSRAPWPVQRDAVAGRVADAFGRRFTVRTLRYRAFGSRAFFCLSTRPAMARRVDAALAVLSERVSGDARARHLVVE